MSFRLFRRRRRLAVALLLQLTRDARAVTLVSRRASFLRASVSPSWSSPSLSGSYTTSAAVTRDANSPATTPTPGPPPRPPPDQTCRRSPPAPPRSSRRRKTRTYRRTPRRGPLPRTYPCHRRRRRSLRLRRSSTRRANLRASPRARRETSSGLPAAARARPDPPDLRTRRATMRTPRVRSARDSSGREASPPSRAPGLANRAARPSASSAAATTAPTRPRTHPQKGPRGDRSNFLRGGELTRGGEMRGRTARGDDARARTGIAPVAEDGAEQRIVSADGSGSSAAAAQKIVRGGRGARNHRRSSPCGGRTWSRRGGRAESAEEVVDVAQGAEGFDADPGRGARTAREGEGRRDGRPRERRRNRWRVGRRGWRWGSRWRRPDARVCEVARGGLGEWSQRRARGGSGSCGSAGRGPRVRRGAIDARARGDGSTHVAVLICPSPKISSRSEPPAPPPATRGEPAALPPLSPKMSSSSPDGPVGPEVGGTRVEPPRGDEPDLPRTSSWRSCSSLSCPRTRSWTIRPSGCRDRSWWMTGRLYP